MPSKGVLDRQRVGKALIATARTHAHSVGDRLQSKLAVDLPDGETPSQPLPPELTRFQVVLARTLERRLDALVEADGTHLDVRRAVSLARDRRDEAAGALYRKIADLRAAARGAYGRGGLRELLVLDGPAPEGPFGLRRWAERLIAVLAELPSELPPPRWKGLKLSLSGAAEELRALAGALGRALRAVDDEVRKLESTRREKYRAIAAFDETVRGVAPALRGLYRLAGCPELGARIRVTLPNTRAATTASRKEV